MQRNVRHQRTDTTTERKNIPNPEANNSNNKQGGKMKIFTVKNIIPAIYCDCCKKVLRKTDRYVIFETARFPVEFDRVCIKCLTSYIEEKHGQKQENP